MIVSDASFDRVLRSDKPTVVMLWQRGCEPCAALVPILVEVAKEKPDMQFVLMNSQDNPNTKASYGVTACPTMLLFEGGEMRGRWMGAVPKNKVLNWIDRTLGVVDA